MPREEKFAAEQTIRRIREAEVELARGVDGPGDRAKAWVHEADV